MKVYLFMGTHLPELVQCMEALARSADASEPIQEFVPEGLGWPSRSESLFETHLYQPETVEWTIGSASESVVFIVIDPRLPQVPQLELLADALKEAGLEPIKVITCVDTTVAESSPQYRTWLEACIYYSDIVLLGNRSSAAKSFVREFQVGYEKQCYPCRFLLLKGPGKPERPLEILAPHTRRLAQLFDLGEDAPELTPGVIVEASCDLDLEEPEADPFRISDADESETPPVLPLATKWIVPIPE